MFLLAAALLARAQDVAPAGDRATAEAKAHFRRGTELYREARYREAIAEFETANRLRPHGVIFYNLAQCHERLGDLAAALRAYHEYLRSVPNAEDRASVNAAMANIEARLGASGVQQLLVYSEPEGADVFIDGLLRGRTPFAAVLPHGAHRLSIQKQGYATVAREALLAADRSVEIDVALAPAPSPPPVAAAAATAVALAPKQVAPPAIDVTAPAPAPSAGPRSRLWTWIAAGAAVAAAATGAAYAASAQGASSDLHAKVNDGATAQRLADTAASRSHTANALYGAAAVAGAASVGLFFIEGTF